MTRIFYNRQVASILHKSPEERDELVTTRISGKFIVNAFSDEFWSITIPEKNMKIYCDITKWVPHYNSTSKYALREFAKTYHGAKALYVDEIKYEDSDGKEKIIYEVKAFMLGNNHIERLSSKPSFFPRLWVGEDDYLYNMVHII